MTRRTFLLFSTAAAAMLAIGGQRAAWADATAPVDQPLQALYAALEGAMRAGPRASFPQRFDALAPVVDRVFDLETVLKVSVGLRWDAMNADARQRLLTTFQRFTVATYVANFDKYDGERFQILPGARDSGSDRIVGTEIVSGNGDHTRLDYVMRSDNGAWRAVDVLLEGSISRVAVQRSDFRKILASGDADALIASLRQKITDLSDGSLNS
ncbi:ABC transporter substrate-binding protein [Acidisphaera sp. S103]|uniref:ABC transporter substrate-binding protein n=1 Tax=Acidisphaera sp. S103 TaxID=1747223 RepID=UPI00131DD646|nr:ABC transporter substrate-binding protein [Acidisphaera sp. S103]